VIYFDNAATTYPKPDSVRRAVMEAMVKCGGNPGRSGHKMSRASASAVYSVREKAAALFGASPENVIFTANCTQSVNMAVKGLAETALREGKPFHVIISSLEHNSVLRPVHELTKRGLTYSIAEVSPDDEVTLHNIESLVKPSTKAIVCTLGSNVTGKIPPYKMIGEICRRRGLCFIADGAQACGILDIRLSHGINILCTSGHKGLYGITGTGLLVTDGKFPIKPIITGGTGSLSQSLKQPDFLPDCLESGTVNVIGIHSLKAGVDFISNTGTERIFNHEKAVCDRFIRELSKIPSVTVYRKPQCRYVPIVSFNVNGFSPEETASYLSQRGFCLRAGFHCAPLAHSSLGTENGTVRFSPSYFSRLSDAVALANSIKNMAELKKSQKTIEITS